MSKKKPTIYEEALAKGYSRRDFMKLCTIMGAFMGLKASGVAQIAEALETKTRLPIIWLHGQECTGCSESFIKSSHPLVADIILDKVSLDYTETLMAASGHQAEAALEETMKKYKGEYLMVVEGAVPLDNDGVYCVIGGKSFIDRVKEVADGASAIITWGSCSSFGGIQAAAPNPTGSASIDKIAKGKPVIKVPGCPPIAEVMAGVVVHVLTFGRLPQLDTRGRPMAFYSRRVHDTCYRRPNFDAGLFVETFDDDNARKGFCLYKVGCRGPVTYNSCGVIKWNNGVSYPIQSGHPCIGCSEKDFWDNDPFYEHIPGVPGFGIEKNAEDLGLALGAITVVGLAAHATVTNIRKRRAIQKDKPYVKKSNE